MTREKDLYSNIEELAQSEEVNFGEARFAAGESDVRLIDIEGCGTYFLNIYCEAGSAGKVVVKIGKADNLVLKNVVNVDASASLEMVVEERGIDGKFGYDGFVTVSGGNFKQTILATGNNYVINKVRVDHEANGGTAELNAFYVADEKQFIDNISVVKHTVGGCETHQLYKGVCGKESFAAFTGTMVVEQDAQKSVAMQTCKHLITSESAKVKANPHLEIFADDVKCKHGASTATLDQNQLFYLQQRGLSEENARDLLRQAYAMEVIEKIGIESVKAEYIEEE